MWIDYHVHTTLSDGKEEHEAYINRALELNLRELGFSDHICHKKVEWRMEPENIPMMMERVTSLKEEYKDKLCIKFGAEVDFIPGEEEKIAKVIQGLPLDYVIGSIHYIDDWNYDSDPSKFERLSIFELYDIYFKTVRDSARSGLFDIMGHADLIKKFGHYPKENIDHFYDETAAVFKECDVVAELNTNGLNKDCRDFYPSERFLQYLYKYDVPVIISSDSHRSVQLTQYFDKALQLLKKTGYKKIAVFTNRQRSFIDLP